MEDREGRQETDRERREETGRERREETLRDALRPPGPVQFEITQTEEPGLVRLQIRGELDVLTIPRLTAQLNTLVHRSKANVVLDLRQTTFIDSAGLQILLTSQRRLARLSRKLTVECEDGPVRRVFELTRLAEPLGLTGDQKDTGG